MHVAAFEPCRRHRSGLTAAALQIINLLYERGKQHGVDWSYRHHRRSRLLRHCSHERLECSYHLRRDCRHHRGHERHGHRRCDARREVVVCDGPRKLRSEEPAHLRGRGHSGRVHRQVGCCEVHRAGNRGQGRHEEPVPGSSGDCRCRRDSHLCRHLDVRGDVRPHPACSPDLQGMQHSLASVLRCVVPGCLLVHDGHDPGRSRHRVDQRC